MRNNSGRWVVLPDMHVPHHYQLAVRAVLRCVHDVRPQHLVLLGDFLDLYSIAQWNDGSLALLKTADLQAEYDAGNAVLDQIEAALPKGCAKHYLWGNHEDRFQRFMMKGDNARMGKALITPERGLRLRERGWKWYDNRNDDFVAITDDLHVVHGEWCTLHTAKKHLDAHRRSVIFGHTHRVQTFKVGPRAGYNIGHLMDTRSAGAEYASRLVRETWSEAFAVVDVHRGHAQVQVVEVQNGHFHYGQRAYAA